MFRWPPQCSKLVLIGTNERHGYNLSDDIPKIHVDGVVGSRKSFKLCHFLTKKPPESIEKAQILPSLISAPNFHVILSLL